MTIRSADGGRTMILVYDVAIPAAPEELARLARRHRTCTLLSDAPRAVVWCGHP